MHRLLSIVFGVGAAAIREDRGADEPKFVVLITPSVRTEWYIQYVPFGYMYIVPKRLENLARILESQYNEAGRAFLHGWFGFDSNQLNDDGSSIIVLNRQNRLRLHSVISAANNNNHNHNNDDKVGCLEIASPRLTVIDRTQHRQRSCYPHHCFGIGIDRKKKRQDQREPSGCSHSRLFIDSF